MNPEWTVSDRLRKARQHAALGQRELADRMGVSRQTVSNYENANTKPQQIVLNAWAAVTQVDKSWLTGGAS